MEEKAVIKIFQPETSWQGELIVQELKAANIDAYLANQTTMDIWGGVTPLGDLEILVPEDQAEKAKQVIDEFLKQMGGPVVDEADLDKQAEESGEEPE